MKNLIFSQDNSIEPNGAIGLQKCGIIFWQKTGKRKTPFTFVNGVFNGADDEARTRYLHLGKVALYQMSYIRMFCRRFQRRVLL